MYACDQVIWGDTWKHTAKKSQTNATSVTIRLLLQMFWGHLWKYTMEKSQTNASCVIIHLFRLAIWGSILKTTVWCTLEKGQSNYSEFEFPQNLSIFSASVKVCNCGLGPHADQTAEMVPSTQQRLYATHIIWVCSDILIFFSFIGRFLADIWVICQIDCKGALLYSQVPGHELKASKEMVMVSLMYGVIARLKNGGYKASGPQRMQRNHALRTWGQAL